MDLAGHVRDGFVNAGMHAKGQAVARAVDGVEQGVEFVALVAHHVQYRAEDFARQLADVVDLDDGRRDEGAVAAFAVEFHLVHTVARGAHRLDVPLDAVARFRVDHGPHVHRQAVRVAHAKFAHGAAQHGQHVIGIVFLHAQHAQRGAALACRIEGRGQHVEHDLLGQGRGIHHHGVLAAGLGDQRNGVAVVVQAVRQRARDDARDVGGAGEHHAAHAGIGHQLRTHGFAAARQQLHGAGGYAGRAQDGHGLRRDQRRLFGGLGQHGIAGGQRGRDLAREDGQREVPGADAQHGAQRAVRVVAEFGFRLVGVIAQEIHGLAHLGYGVGQRLAGFAHDQAQQGLHLLFQQLRGAAQALRALGHRRGLPDRRGIGGGAQGGLGLVRLRLDDVAHHVAQIGGVADLDGAGGIPCLLALAQHGAGAPRNGGAGQQGRGQRAQAMLVAQIQARGVDPRTLLRIAIEFARQRNLFVRRAQRHDARGGLDGIGHQLFDRNGLVADQVHERGVGAVFQQAAHQVGQQGFMRADRRIDAAGTVELALRQRTHHLVVQRFAHAVQALELILAGIVVLPRQLIDRGQGVGVVRGELREHRLGRAQQLAGAGQVGHVGVDLARVDRIAFQAVDLGALDLAVPVGALDQAHHHAVAAAAGQVDHVVDHERRALLVGLDDEADAVPAVQLGLETERLQQVQRDLQAVGFFRVDVQADVVAARQHGQRLHARQQLGHHAFALAARIARMQRRQLDRNARALIDAAAGSGLADGVDGLLVRGVIAVGVLGRGRGLAQHVVGIAEAAGLHLAVVGQRLGNGLARHELFAHHAHGHVHALAHQRLAALADQPGQRLGQRLLAAHRHQLARDHQAPGGGVDEQGLRAAHVRLPVAAGDLVADQRVARGAVRNAQQRLGQAHERHAFLAGQRKFLDQAFDPAAAALAAQLPDQVGGHGVDLFQIGHAGLAQQQRHALGLGAPVGRGDGRAQHRLRLHVLAEFVERRRGRRMALARLVLAARVHAQVRHLGGQMAALDLVQIGKDRLLVQPVRRAVELLGGGLQPVAERVVDFNA
ncbi:hypothetical protein LMG26858_05800 [Achromobacter anxifer]|uniref:Uncharacterized protein n=1 Tax=Achromobacter anxifer TaxID=1287737 RepID=A0A6S7EWQ4_9BURK|nr:hypothetical protein LMG26858_05800 [Achromobacter anxifer]